MSAEELFYNSPSNKKFTNHILSEMLKKAQEHIHSVGWSI